MPNVSLQVPGVAVAMRNQPVDDAPFGFPEPLSVAVLLVIDVAAAVVTTGWSNVVNDWIWPNEVPSELDATAQK